MSDSRLEKFIYAICSMDVTDLPVPLSRIETLWNCLITGETPDFEPLSRNEKYLMAMLDRYDISNLPAPMSRGEKLLYKIAVGETDLSDVPGYLSRYEELLKYLIENGGISGGDFEYVLYTLNQSLYTLYATAEKPVKSAILKGQTLVNIIDKPCSVVRPEDKDRTGEFTFKYVKPNTDYFVIYDITTDAPTVSIGFLNTPSSWSNNVSDVTVSKGVLKLNSGSNPNYFRFIGKQNATTSTTSLVVNSIMVIEYQDGMENWDIPYFEGMQSVKMPVLTVTGKNLFNSTFIRGNRLNETGAINQQMSYMTTADYINIKNVDSAMASIGDGYRISQFFLYDDNGNFISRNGNPLTNTANATKCHITIAKNPATEVTDEDLSEVLKTFQLEQGSVATSFEPYKTNILTVSEDVTLRGIGDVQDTLDCLTGEVTERIGEVVLNGSEKWVFNRTTTDYTVWQSDMTNPALNTIQRKNNVLCDKYIVEDFSGFNNKNYEFISIGDGSSKTLYLKLDTAKATRVTELKTYLNSNPLTVQYQLATNTVKTVDLTVVDQDNRPTQLGTFENVTHVSLEAENLIPEVEMEVATRISTELASASPLMDDISTEQQQLNTTVDEQSENVDATMIATTEIFEEIL